jgi:2-polyprenyl-6-methoxyphenol hydroxylase-like FAD-dependent oxidoreductase
MGQKEGESMTDTYDVIICGASVAGCTAAVLYARRGARVALVERRSDPAAHKVLCTHYIQPCAYPVIDELGLVGELDAAGAVRNSAKYWTRWGWIEPDGAATGDLPHGYNVRRQTLDPMLRALAGRTDGVDLLVGRTVERLVTEGGRVVGVAGGAGANAFELTARLVVGADGKDSAIAKLADVPTKTVDNQRFSYFAQFKGLPRPAGDITMSWFREPDVAYAMPNDGDITIVAVIPSKDRLGEFKTDLEGAYRKFVAALPGGPDIDNAELVGKIVGTVNYPLVIREPIGNGYALIGDAALTSDPLWGVGCGWAFQSATWLVDATSAAVRGSGDLGHALAGYRKRRAQLKGHQFLISDYASGRPFNHIEKLMFAAAARDDGMAELFHVFGSRLIGVRKFLSPAKMTRAAFVNGRHRLRPKAKPALVGTKS